jgi:glycerol-3-phosphate cytidylyltransferase
MKDDIIIGKHVDIGDNVNIGSETPHHFTMKVGFTCGAFDLLHAGHVLMLEEAKSICDYLVVGLHADPNKDRAHKNSPIQSYEERIIQVKALRFVDEIILYETEDDLLKVLKKVNPDIRILGADWQGKKFTGWELPIEIYFNSRDHSYSTTDLRQRVYESEKEKIDWNNARR